MNTIIKLLTWNHCLIPYTLGFIALFGALYGLACLYETRKARQAASDARRAESHVCGLKIARGVSCDREVGA